MTPKTINEIISVSIGALAQFLILIAFGEIVPPEKGVSLFPFALVASFAAGVFMYTRFKDGG